MPQIYRISPGARQDHYPSSRFTPQPASPIASQAPSYQTTLFHPIHRPSAPYSPLTQPLPSKIPASCVSAKRTHPDTTLYLWWRRSLLRLRSVLRLPFALKNLLGIMRRQMQCSLIWHVTTGCTSLATLTKTKVTR